MNAAQAEKLRERLRTRAQVHTAIVETRKCIRMPNLVVICTVGFYLPPPKKVSFAFLQQLLCGEKRGLTAAAVSQGKVPTYPELSVNKLWLMVKADVAIRQFLPDPVSVDPANPPAVAPKYHCDKTFIWKVIEALRPDMAKSLLLQARKNRISHKQE